MVSKTWNSDLNLGRNQLQNAVVQRLSSAPTSPVAGLIYYDTNLNQFGYYNGSTWIYSTAATAANVTKTNNSGAMNTVQVSGGTDKSIQDFAPSGAGIVKVTSAGVASIAVSKTDYAPATTGSAALKGDGSGGFAAATLNDVGTATAAYSLGGFRVTNVADPTAAQDAATKNYVDTGLSSNSTSDRARANHTGTQTSSTISDFASTVQATRLDQFAAPTNPVSFNSQRITALADPTAATDAATKQYVDAAAVGIDFKPSVRALAITNVTVSSPGTTIGGVTLAAGDRVLLTGQSTASENGIYVWTASGSALTRSTDANTNAKVTPGMLTYVEEGGGQGQQWILTTTGAITLGTTALTFTQFSGASTLTAGAGLAAAGNVFNVGAGAGIVVAADTVGIDTSLVPQKKLFTLGDGTATTFTLTHNLGTQDVVVSIRDASTNEVDLGYQVVATSTSAVTVTGNTAPASNGLRAVVIG